LISLRFDQLAETVGGSLLDAGVANRRFTGASIDSRSIKDGELFIALRGERADGHEYVAQAFANGAAGALVESRFEAPSEGFGSKAVVVVKRSHAAMLELARSYRTSCATKIVGITGSNGKTTTKEFANALMKAVEERSYKSPGNFNNLFGAPLALMAMPSDTKYAAIEMGISTKGEMKELAAVVQPDVFVVTNVGPSHLEFLGTTKEVARAKLEAVGEMPTDAPVVVNADDAILMEQAGRLGRSLATFGIDADADTGADKIEAWKFGSVVTIDGAEFNLPLPGRHQVYNLLAAYAACKAAGLGFSSLDTSKIRFDSAPMRGEIMKRNGISIVADCYNANPESVKAGLESFAAFAQGSRSIVILGDMLELGEQAERYHRKMGRQAASYDFDRIVAVGSFSKTVVEEATRHGFAFENTYCFATANECGDAINQIIKPGDVLFVKGSRGVALEKIIDQLGSAEENT
jgi:UDP-N-acetylmuramoyl-tripeptide--D-alanyl-D-alanine ligase